jgi:NADH-quinone oxidoreductase subunit J
MIAKLLFYTFAALAVATAWTAVCSRNLFHSALALAGMLGCIAGLYMTIGAEFLAAIQIIIYIGGVVVLIVFAIMLLADATSGQNPPASVVRRVFAVMSSVLLFALIVLCVKLFGFQNYQSLPPKSAQISSIGEAFLSINDGFILPFELISILLVIVMVGALTMARQDSDSSNSKDPTFKQ